MSINYSQVQSEWKEIHTGTDNLTQLYKGIQTLCDAVQATMGAKGRTVIIHDATKDTTISTKDGVTVAKSIILKDSVENIGANQIKQVAENVVKAAGDGTTTATVFTTYLTKVCIGLIAKGVAPYDITRSLETLRELMLSHLEESIHYVEGEEDVKNIAYIASNSDDEITNLIVKAVMEFGEDTVINIEHGSSAESYVEETKGYSINRGFLNHNFKDPNRVTVEYHNPLILITKEELVGTYDVEHIVAIAMEENRPLVIIAKDFLQDAYNYLAMNKLHRGLPILPIKAPNFGEEQHHILHDLATYTNACVISKESGFSLGMIELDDFGSCDYIKAGSDYTHIFNGHYDENELNERVEGLRGKLKDTEDRDKHDHFIKGLKERISKLEGGIATIYVGGFTTQEIAEKYDRVEDSLLATLSAIEEGYIVGGGLFYLRLGLSIRNYHLKYGDNILAELASALMMPAKIIIENAMLQDSIVYKESLAIVQNSLRGKQTSLTDSNYWVNVSTETACNMLEDGIIDAAKSTRAIINNGISFAKTFITTHATVVHKINYFQNIQ